MIRAEQVKRSALCVVTVALSEASGLAEAHMIFGATLLVGGAIWNLRNQSLWPLSLSLFILLTLAPVEFTLGKAADGSFVILQNLLTPLGLGLLVWAATHSRLRHGFSVAVPLLLGALIFLESEAPVVPVTDQNMSQLERALVGGDQTALAPWVRSAMASNVGPSRIRQFCNLRTWRLRTEDPEEAYVQTICDAVTERFPEVGANDLSLLGKGVTYRLAADLYAQAGQWGAAARATKDAVTHGGLHAALNLWRWRAIKGKASRKLKTWQAWNAEMDFEGPQGAERSALRITRAPGKLLSMHVGPDQRAVQFSTRYRDAFVVELPGPPPGKAREIRLKGSAGRSFSVEVLDAEKQWHAFNCSDSLELRESTFCQTLFGEANVVLSESVIQPIRHIRLRGEATLARVEVLPK